MRKICLFCTAGMSTSLLVSKMKKYADSINYECDIEAYPISEVKKYGANADVVLIGPQVRYELNNVKSQLGEGKIVEAIDMRLYGMMNGTEVIKRCKELLGD
ncbi:PTS sugar transporter subunit IIB [Faecalicoccus pleomorphus]|uniref:PTS sugar transporter subunit IIB n=1 Tax=Faecalicoccus pleomorphus TaxID=1323 RepID=A0A7X9NG45_9FIRM|nr:PTS sugar transporter subunit IIB [Faecalicoccus pleomorphus]NME43605.1 PTS sugar transporter subunit IIB [Faecalicoccus pleomorphus]